MSADSLNTTTYNDVIGNTANRTVLDSTKIRTWRQNVKAVVDQHATEINTVATTAGGKVSKSGDTMTGDLFISKAVPRLVMYDSTFGGTDTTLGNATSLIVTSPDGSLLFSVQNAAKTGLVPQVKIETNTGIFTLINGQMVLNATVVKSGAGSPEGAVTAPVSSLYLRTDGGAGTTLYVKQSGTGNTGWVGK